MKQTSHSGDDPLSMVKVFTSSCDIVAIDHGKPSKLTLSVQVDTISRTIIGFAFTPHDAQALSQDRI